MKKTAQERSKSLKTLYLYLLLVFVLIIVSLVVKGISIIQQSKYDASHHFTLAVIEQNKVKEIISFNPQTPAIWALVIQNNNLPYQSLAKDYGVTANAYIQVNSTAPINSDIIGFLWSSIIHTASWQSDITLYDKIRLFLLAKSVTTNNKTIEDVTLSEQSPEVGTTVMTALTDQDIANENVSIKIVNATNITGFGERLARVLTNLGANVIDIATAQEIQKNSSLTYYGSESYTLDRIQQLLHIIPTKIPRQGIADIVITIGTDKKNTTEF